MPSPESISHIRRDLLSRPVRDYADNLKAQILQAFMKHEARNTADFERLVEAKRVPEPELRRIKDLITRLREVVQSGKLPDDAHAEILGAKLREAKDLLGEHNVFGPDQITQAWNIDLDPDDIPPIPYSTEDLEKAKNLGEILILRLNTDGEGNPLTIKRIQELTDPLLAEQGQGTSVYPYDWHKTDPLITTETPSLTWALISPDILPNTTFKNYLDQTLTLKDYLKQHNLLTPEEEAELDDTTIKHLRKLIEEDWRKASETLSNLKINQHHRRSAPEAVYDTLFRFLITGERPLERAYDWTWSRSSDGNLVGVGPFGAQGAGVRRWDPDDALGVLGVSSSR